MWWAPQILLLSGPHMGVSLTWHNGLIYGFFFIQQLHFHFYQTPWLVLLVWGFITNISKKNQWKALWVTTIIHGQKTHMRKEQNSFFFFFLFLPFLLINPFWDQNLLILNLMCDTILANIYDLRFMCHTS